MFGNLKQKLQSLSPLASPVASPTSSPKTRRRGLAGAFRRHPARLKQRRDEFREVQSDPECDFGSTRQRRKTSDPPRKVYFESGGYAAAPGGQATAETAHDGSITMGRAAGHTQVQRLVQYERYFQDLLAETPETHPDVDDLGRVRGRLKQLVSTPGDGLSELERVQALFPADDLNLFSRDTSNQRMKGLIRKRSAPASRLHRALSAKTQRPSSAERAGVDDDKENGVPTDATDSGGVRRQFVMETAVTFTVGLQSQERHLFLFSDMLLVAKARSGGNFKLKDKVRLSEMWLAPCLDDDAEVAKDPASSFVMGWPITNVVATFSGPARDLWYNKLQQLIAAERERDLRTSTIQVVYRDPSTNTDHSKTVAVTSSTTAADCVQSAVSSLQLEGSGDGGEFQLWVRPGGDQPACPLIGPELPLAVQTSVARELAAEEGPDLDHCNNIYSTAPAAADVCQFLLRPAGADLRALSPSPDSSKKKKLPKKSPIRIHKVFRRTTSKSDSVDSAVGLGQGALFGQPLSRLCSNGGLPPPVMAMLVQLFRKGPYTVGIFRKSANARIVKEIKEKLDSNIEVDMEAVNIYAVAGLAKDFLRSLPDPLLGSELYDEWRKVADIEDEHERILRVRELCTRLPEANVTLLCHFLCVLHHVARRSHHNLMSAANVAVCVGPSLLAPACPTQAMTSDGAKRLPAVVALMVDRCDVIFGSQCLRLFGGRTARADSGEESDAAANGDGVRRDDSSIDSLERVLLGENEPLPRKDKMAATNLSRDSGLTLSDTQLYALDDEESASTSSGQSAHKSEHSACSSGRGSDNSYQNRSTDGSGVYAAPSRRPGGAVRQGRSSSPAEALYARPPLRHVESVFQRQDWTRQHHPLRRSGKAAIERKSLMRRSTSEESLSARCEEGPQQRVAQPTQEMASAAHVSPPATMLRSRSAHHIAQLRDSRLAPPAAAAAAEHPGVRHWPRSRSTPHIDDTDRSYDSSTLSDDDSTPHVSRSNSRSKDCALANDLWERAYGGAALESRSESGVRSGRASLTSRAGSIRAAGADSLPGTPPSYDSTISRRQRHAGGAARPSRGSVYALPEQVIREQTILSSRAKQLYAESLRLYNQQTANGADMVYASPVRAVNSCEDEATPPPLPPKQKPPLRRLTGRGASVPEEAAARSERTVIQISDSGSVRARRPVRRVSRREAETQTESCITAAAGSDALDERKRRTHVTLVSIDASAAASSPGRCPRPGESADSWSAEEAAPAAQGGRSVSRLREIFSQGEVQHTPVYRHPPLRRTGGDIYASPAELYSDEVYSSPADIYASVPTSARAVPLGRTQSGSSSNDGEESYV